MKEQHTFQNQSITYQIRKEFSKFLESNKNLKGIIEGMGVKGYTTIVFDYNDFFQFDPSLAYEIFDNFYKYQNLLSSILTQYATQLMKASQKNKNQQNQEDKYYVTFNSGIDGPNSPSLSLRNLSSHKLGKLISLRGTVTRTTQVRPEVISGTFTCTQCKGVSKLIPQQFRYTTPKKCIFDRCDSTTFDLLIDQSQLADFQKLRVQQEPGCIPAGGMPRSIDVIVRNQNAQKGQPGDLCKFVGYLCVVPEMQSMIKPGQKAKLSTLNVQTRGKGMDIEGIHGIKGFRQLNYRYIFIANNITVQNNQFNQQITDEEQYSEESKQRQQKMEFSEQYIFKKISNNLTHNQLSQITQLKRNPNLMQDIAESLFSSIHGHAQIKKALVLQLLGGIHKVTSNKINIRGDINVLIVGDPSTAKSHFLKCVNKFVPRSVYTNGKTTSAAGLTASVSKDENGNVSIEAGALMLADNGICCIDQFDKMDLKDQTAIHEAMEQQTISIAKAGVHATLNARTSILAAANPIFGRYDKSKSLKNNLNLTAPIMSRFDLFFVVYDEALQYSDQNLCQFMIKMHRNDISMNTPKYDRKTLKNYFSFAKKIQPQLTLQAAQKLRECYLKLRSSQITPDRMSYRPTVRQLESMIRLCQAYARLNLELKITKEYVQQVYNLIRNSIVRLEKPVQIEQEDEPQHIDEPQGHYLDKQLKNKEKTVKKKTIQISFEEFEKIKKSLYDLFKLKDQFSEEDNTIYNTLTQQELIHYIIAHYSENSDLIREQQIPNFRKLARSLLKKLINDERMLIIHENHEDQNLRKIGIHPNYHQYQ